MKIFFSFISIFIIIAGFSIHWFLGVTLFIVLAVIYENRKKLQGTNKTEEQLESSEKDTFLSDFREKHEKKEIRLVNDLYKNCDNPGEFKNTYLLFKDRREGDRLRILENMVNSNKHLKLTKAFKASFIKICDDVFEKKIELARKFFKEKFKENIDSFDLDDANKSYENIKPENKYGLYFPSNEYYEGNIDLSEYLEIGKIIFPKKIKGNIDLSKISSAEGITFPEHLDGTLKLSCLSPGPDGELQEKGLDNVEGLSLPKHIQGNLILINLRKIKELKLPKYVGGDIRLDNLEKAEKITFPERIDGSLNISKLQNSDHVILPKYIGGSLNMNYIDSIHHITLPKHIKGSLIANSLTSIEKINSIEIDGSLNIYDMPKEDVENLIVLKPDLQNKIHTKKS